MDRRLLGGLAPRDFLARHWQVAPLLVRGAVPGIAPPLDRKALFALAARDDVESRLVVRSGARRWAVERGPFPARALRALPSAGWTLLVQGANLHDAAADRLLRRFAFIPYARLDDLMVSYAVRGGGVGPHFDSYDVFLLQAAGRRRWAIGAQSDLELVPRLPLKILRRFEPEQAWVLEPGDMLYLPPRFAHDGVALDECMTCSIGFRAPSAGELVRGFLDFLQERVPEGEAYADPGLRATGRPALLPREMRRRVRATLERIAWSGAQADEFLGCFLSEPKPQVFFEPPARPLSARAFAARARREGVRLDARSQLLYDGTRLYVNGEALALRTSGDAPLLRRLADRRALPPNALPTGELPEPIYEWYRAGFLHAGGHA